MKTEMINVIGTVTNVINDRNFQFIVNNNIEVSFNQIVGINTDKNTYLLSIITNIDFKFYLTKPEFFFITKASRNELDSIYEGDDKPKYCRLIDVRVIGYYKFEKSKALTKIDESIDRYTAKPLDKVYSFNWKTLSSVYGISLDQNSMDKDVFQRTIKVGSLIDSIKSVDVNLEIDVFRSHSLIVGVTGSGKSRLTALICQRLAKNGIHVTILDPHFEYFDLIRGSNVYEIYNFSRSKYVYKDIEKRNNEYFSELKFYEKNITPEILKNLLPSITKQQEEELDSIYKEITENRIKPEKKLQQKFFNKYNIKLNDYIDIIDERIRERAGNSKNDNVSEKKPSILDVYFAIKRKLNTIKEENILIEETSVQQINWLDENPNNCVDILNIDYSNDEFIRRFINSFILFFTKKKMNEFRLLVIDEAHLLLNEKNSKTYTLVTKLLREARKFNTAVILVTQNLFDIPDEITSQFQNTFMFRDQNNEQTKYLSNRNNFCKLANSDIEFAFRVDKITKAKF